MKMHNIGGWSPSLPCLLGCFEHFQLDGVTPLFMAANNGHDQAVRALLQAGAAVAPVRLAASVVGLGCPTVSHCLAGPRSLHSMGLTQTPID